MNKKMRVILAIVILSCLPVFGAKGLAEVSAEPKAAAVDRAEIIQGKIDELQNQIRIFAEAEREDVAKGLNVTLEQLRERTEVLEETRSFYTQQLQGLNKNESLLREKTDIRDKISTGEALQIENEPPYALKLYDDFNLKLADNTRNLGTTMLAAAGAEKALLDARERYQKASTQSRSLKEGLGKAQNAQDVLAAQWLFEQAEREAGLSEALTGYQEQVLANTREEAEIFEIKVDLYRQISERIRKNLYFDPADLENQLALLDERKKERQAQVDKTRKNLRQANRKLSKAQKKAELAKGEDELAKARDNLLVAEQWRQTYQVQLEQGEGILRLFSILKQLWKQRYDLIKGEIPREDMASLKKESEKYRERLRQSIALEQERQTNLQLQIGKLEEQGEQEGLSWDARGDLDAQQQALVKLAGSTINYITVLNRSSQMNLQFIYQLERIQKGFDFGKYVKVLMAKMKGWWQAELFVIDDQSLTVRKIVIAIVSLVLGIIISGILSRLLRGQLLKQFSFTASSAAITSKLVFYALFFLLVLFTMRFVNIPLTVFTLFGGAIAIGVGFGAQKLINNFISGFIIMAEQPIRVGDLVMMDNEPCWIEEIGARSTRVRTYDNVNILVPNSFFLENNITNWTHNDNIVRGRVKVGVAYGSPTREVRAALLKAADEHGEIRKQPEPYVWFGDFADNSLVFELYFWVMVTESVGIQRISSDLRFMIDNLFREAGITIAFPQRDLHFDSGGPLQIELTRSKKENGA